MWLSESVELDLVGLGDLEVLLQPKRFYDLWIKEYVF